MVEQARILVVGSLNMDLVVRVSRMPLIGETILGESFQMVPGGKGANQAVAAARLGANVSMLGVVGDDSFGEKLVQSLQNDNVDTRMVCKHKGKSSGIATITVDDKGRNSIIVVPGANMELTHRQIESAYEEICKADIVLLQLEIPMSGVQKTIELAKKAGKKVLLNPAPAQKISRDLLEQVDYLVPNERELELLTGMEVDGLKGAELAVRKLRNEGVKIIIVTLGKNGVLLANSEFITHLPAYEVDAVDTTAAGDAFIGGFAVSIARGDSIYRSIRYANAVAALTVTRFGAQTSLPTKQEVEEFLQGKIN